MGSLLAGFTTRGRAFIAAGIASGILGLGLGQRTLLSIGGLLVILPVLSVLAASRTRYRIRWVRELSPSRVPAGQTASVTIRLDNVSRLPTGLLLTEDTVPYSIGARPGFILDRIEPGGSRQLSHPIQRSRCCSPSPAGPATAPPTGSRVKQTRPPASSPRPDGGWSR
jgi:hypothetical protein